MSSNSPYDGSTPLLRKREQAVEDDLRENIIKQNIIPNFFILDSFNGLYYVYTILHYLFAEFSMGLAQAFVPSVLAMLWSSAVPPTSVDALRPMSDPMVALLVALATSSVLYAGYISVPGATGNPFFILEQLVLEIVSECKETNSKEIEASRGSKCVTAFMFIVKASLGIAAVFLGAYAGTQFAIFAVPGAPSALVSPVSQAIDENFGRAVLLEFVGFTIYSVVFNRTFRVGPHGHLPLGRTNSSSVDVLQIAAVNFVVVLILYGITGSTLNCVRAWASATTKNDSSAYTFFIGQLLGSVLGFLLSFYMYHSPRFLFTTTFLGGKKGTTKADQSGNGNL